MDGIKALLRYFSYLYHGLLCLFLLGLSAMALATGMHSLQLDVLPWKGTTLTYWIFFGPLLGLMALLMSVKRIFPSLFVLWALIVMVMLVRGYIFSGYYFDTGEFRLAMWLIAGSLIALAGAWFGMNRRREY